MKQLFILFALIASGHYLTDSKPKEVETPIEHILDIRSGLKPIDKSIILVGQDQPFKDSRRYPK